jgi:FkbM family methyltransferase
MFAVGVTRTLPGLVRLLVETVLFHLSNAGNRRTPSRPFRVPVKLDRLRTDIWLRRASGDIFIFYEVLKGGIYALRGSVADNARVRTVVDCGGNIGISAIYFADRYPNARIITIEPLAENFEILRRNVAGIERIVPVLGCVSDTDGERFFTTDQATWGNAISDKPTSRKVPAFSLATILKKHGIENVDVLKVDIEGEEKILFKQAEFLRQTGAVLIELHEGYPADHFQRDVSPYGFTVKLYDPGVAAHQIAAVRA